MKIRIALFCVNAKNIKTEVHIPGTNKKASIRWQDSALPISGYWPTSEPNAS